ncbi:MAG TPA: AAA family ATPase, partial [Candidatus Binataceae bacterium]|nr:AAA family ATPase [Candidatus Binataceae bacterium]
MAATPDFFGRQRELRELLRGLDDTLSGTGRAFLLAGESGIGKSRLAQEFARQASNRAMVVLWGPAWDEGGAPFWPWRQMIRQCLFNPHAHDVLAELGPSRHDLTIVAPEVSRHVEGETGRAPLPEDPELARLRIFDSVTSFFEIFSRFAPPLLMIDNLHAVDVPSLRLLRFMCVRLAHARAMIIGTFDDAALGHDALRSEVVGALSAEMVRIPLAGLDRDDLRDLFGKTAGHPISHDEAAALEVLTGGNPLFALELARAGYRSNELTAGASRPPLTNAFRATVRRHLSPLDDCARRLLSVASVIGREFDGLDLRTLAEVDEEAAAYALDEALKAHLFVPVAAEAGSVRFHHALLRDALYDEVEPMEKARLHARWGDILVGRSAEGFRVEPAELAYHFQRGIAAGSARQTVEYAYRAAVVADSRLAYEEAERFYTIALRALRDEPSDVLRCEVLIGLGIAQQRSGNFLESRNNLLAAAHLADRIGAFEHEARAVLVMADRSDVHLTDSETVTILRRLGEVRAALPNTMRAAVLGGLA